jgi:hypothetical protein
MQVKQAGADGFIPFEDYVATVGASSITLGVAATGTRSGASLKFGERSDAGADGGDGYAHAVYTTNAQQQWAWHISNGSLSSGAGGGAAAFKAAPVTPPATSRANPSILTRSVSASY